MGNAPILNTIVFEAKVEKSITSPLYKNELNKVPAVDDTVPEPYYTLVKDVPMGVFLPIVKRYWALLEDVIEH